MSSIDASHAHTLSKIVVVGATGRLGKCIRPYWKDLSVLWQSRRVEHGFETVDILNDPKGMRQLINGADAVLCLAGETYKPNANMALNVDLARAVLDAAQDTAAGRVFLASSAAVYGAATGLLTEDGPAMPQSDYGRAKLDMEHMAQAHAHPYTALRIGNIAGADAILAGWTPGMALDQLEDGRAPRRSYIGLETLARVLMGLMGQRDLPNRLNVATPGPVSMDSLLDAAGLAYTYRAPAKGVIGCVNLCTKRLQNHVKLMTEDSAPETMVAQWRRSQDIQ